MAGPLKSRFELSRLGCEKGRLRRPKEFLQFLRILPGRRPGKMRRNCKKKQPSAPPLAKRDI